MSEESDMATVVGLLDDEHARTILAATSVEPLSPSDLATRCGASRQTVYRRLERLEDAGLVSGRTQVREDGHHDTVYSATFDRLSVELRDGGYEFELERSAAEWDAADELTRLWRNF